MYLTNPEHRYLQLQSEPTTLKMGYLHLGLTSAWERSHLCPTCPKVGRFPQPMTTAGTEKEDVV